MKIGVIGCAGRMGKNIVREIFDNNACSLAGGIVTPTSPYIGSDIATLIHEDPIGVPIHSDLERLLDNVDAVIDFSSPATTIECARLAAQHGAIHIIGTTGLDGGQIATLKEYAQNVPMVFSSNMSIGVNLLFKLVEQVASILDNSYNIEIVEMHHKHKKDSPSGTALSLGKAAAEGRNWSLSEVQQLSREGIVGAREEKEIGFAAIRGGDVIGDHTVIFAGGGERVELTHKASDRSIYAKGAVKAALWARKQNAGFYSMQDVL